MTWSAGFTQGSTSFQLTQKTADAGMPQVRAPDSPDLVTGSLTEAIGWEATEHLRLAQSVSALFSAPQDDLGQWAVTLVAPVSLDRVYPRDAVGLEFRPSFSLLRPLDAGAAAYDNITNSLLARWNHDFAFRWNALFSAGIEQVLTLSGSYPLAILPTGGVTVQYLMQNAVGSFTYSHGAMTDLQTGTVAASDLVSVRGSLSLDPVRARQLSASAGFVHNEPIGLPPAAAAAGSGNAVQADVGLGWALSDTLVATARFTLAYQFGQGGGLQSALTSVVLIGVTARYQNIRLFLPMPSLGGQRVDGADAVGFPGGGADGRDERR
jgi:hypothetical protein